MKETERFEKIIAAVGGRIQEEVGTLIGAEFVVRVQKGGIISKRDFFDQPSGKLVCAKIDIRGEIEGAGGLFISVKDAIRLGGTLIMLPPAELEDVVAGENYDGETEDSYGEIANIIAGSFTKGFEDMYSKACRFIRKEQGVVSPLKVDPASSEPVPDQLYYQAVMDMQLDDRGLGALVMLIPAIPFGLVNEKQTGAKDEAEAALPERERDDAGTGESNDSRDAAPAAGDMEKQEDPVKPPAKGNAGGEQKSGSRSDTSLDVEKHKRRIDSLLTACQQKVEEEIGVLLGVEVSCGTLKNRLIAKEAFFFEEASGKQVIAHMDVVGDLEDRCYLSVGLKDAIRIGGALIMLPPRELETAVAEEDFGSDCQDAYGEIANIIAGVYTSVFEEQYDQSMRFVKKSIELVAPLKVDIDSDDPMPDRPYYISTMKFSMAGKEYGDMHMLFPARMLRLETYEQRTSAAQGQDEAAAGGQEVKQGGGSEKREAKPGIPQEEIEADVLIISDADRDAAPIKTVLESHGMSWHQLCYRDDVKRYLPGPFKAVFLVMQRVDEHGFGVAIKVSSCCSLPLVAAGPEWTRSTVIRAVKYGVTDILLTPAESPDIEEVIKNNIMQLAA